MRVRPTPETNAGQRRLISRSWVSRLILVLTTLIVSAVLGEVGLRLFFRNVLALVEDERTMMYRYDPRLGWFPISNALGFLSASRPFHVINNSEGFRAPERDVHNTNNNPGILFLGDSYVWGYDVEAADRFTDKLQTRHPEWDIYNFGVSGYGTDQEYLLLHDRFDDYKPRIVFLIYSVETDHDDNSTNIRYGGYYKPYCTIAGNKLQLQGIPVPRGERVFFAEHQQLALSYLMRLLVLAYFKAVLPRELENPDPTGAILRDLHKYVESKGAIFLMGLTRSNPRLEEFLKYFKIPYVDLSTPLRYGPLFGEHWTPEGHTFVCDKVEQFLLQGTFVGSPQLPQTGPGKTAAP